MWTKCLHEVSHNAEDPSGKWRFVSFTTSTGHFDQLILGAPFSLHGFPAPFRRRFPALPCGVIAGYPMQTIMRFSRCGAGFGNKKSPHNNLNLTIPSGMALVRVCYVAIRKLKTCSGSFGSRAGTLSKYVILNCWNRLPQKSNRVNKKFWKRATFGSLQEKVMETLVKREGRIACSVCNGMQTRNFFEQKNNRPLQVGLENGRLFLQSDFQIWEAFWEVS